MSSIPSGTVTFLFTDIEGSTRLWEQDPAAMQASLARHDNILRGSIESNQGYVFRTVGDAFCAAFATASHALDAAIQAQQALYAETWQPPGPIRVRVVLHTGAAELQDGDYAGPTLNRMGRLVQVCNGGQTLLTLATAEQVRSRLPQNISLADLGQHRFRDLAQQERLFQVNIAGLPASFPPLKSLDAFPNNLPVQLTSFVGREREMGDIIKLLDSTHLLTLTGPGGTGKTRLSLQAAAQALECFADGVWLVELASLADPGLVVQSIASTFKLHEQHERSLGDVVVDYLKPRCMLLILDNCEHLTMACAQTSDLLLHACPELKILISSRESLGIAGEVIFRVPSLSLPNEMHSLDLQQISQYESVRLFVERASAVKPSFALTRQNADAVVKICQRLDGVPLAIELAAARVKLLTPEQIAARLDDRFRLLTGGSRTALPRQQTLRALIDWSYELLTKSEKRLLRRLSVFSGGWTLDAAEAIYGAGAEDPESGADVLDLLDQLVNKSLVLANDQGGETRFHMLETIRQYARDKLLETGEAGEVRDLHLDFFFQLAASAYQAVGQAEDINWMKRIGAEYDNMRVALEWAMEKDVEMALELAGYLAAYVGRLGYSSELRRWIRLALDQVEALPLANGEAARRRTLAIGLSGLGITEIVLGENQASAQALKKSSDLWRQIGEPRSLARNLVMLSLAFGLAGEMDQAFAVAEESIAISRQVGDILSQAMAQATMARGFLEQKEYTRAKSILDESIPVLKQLGATWYLGVSYINLGMYESHQGRYEQAQRYLDEAEQIFQEIGDGHFINVVRSNRAEGAFALKDYPAAIQLFQETIRNWQKIGNHGAIARCMECLAFISGAQAEEQGLSPETRLSLLKQAGTLLGAARVVRQAYQSPMTPEEQAEYEEQLAKFKSLPEAEVFDAAYIQGKGMSMEAAIDYSLQA